jgi:hypothetical protein
MPTRTSGKPCWAPTSCTMHRPSRIAAAAVAGPQHQRVPDGLDLMGLMGGQQLAHGHTEPADQVGGLLVPVGLGQGGEA